MEQIIDNGTYQVYSTRQWIFSQIFRELTSLVYAETHPTNVTMHFGIKSLAFEKVRVNFFVTEMTARVDFVVLVDVTCGGSGGELVAFIFLW